jgi:hypothetical protein
MGSLDPIKRKIIIGKHSTTYGGDTNSLFADVHLVQYFSNQAMGNAMGASRAIMGRGLG